MRLAILKTAAAVAILLGTAVLATPSLAGPEVCPASVAPCNPGGGPGGHHHQQQQQQQQQQANAQAVSVNSYGERDPVNTAYATPLIAGDDTCMGSSSIGGQGVGFGLSLGTSWTDTNCQRLKNARQLATLGFSRGAVALICIDEDVRTAMAAAGTPCPSARSASAEEARAPEHVAEVKQDEQKVAENKTGTTSAPAYPVARTYHFVPMQPIKD